MPPRIPRNIVSQSWAARRTDSGTVEYALTPLAATLRGIVGELVTWAQEHLTEIDAARTRYDERAPAVVTADDRPPRAQA